MDDTNTLEVKKTSTAPKYGCFAIGCFGILVIIILLLIFGIIGSLSKLTDNLLTGEPKDAFSEETILRENTSKSKVAVIDISGVILNQRSSYSSSIADSEEIVKLLEKAGKDPDVKAVIISLNTPGGEVTAADDIHRAVMKLKKQKPVVAQMNSLAASGGYYIAVACNKIIAGRLTMTGSIGVIISSYNYKGLLDKIGVSAEVYKSGEMKDMLNGARPRTPQETALIQELVNDSYEEFIKLVSEGRKIPVEKIRTTEIGDGRILHGKKALKLGLVDQLGHLPDAVETAEKLSNIPVGSLSVVRYKKNTSFLDFLFGMEGKAGLQIRLPGMSTEAALPRGRMYYLPGDLCQ